MALNPGIQDLLRPGVAQWRAILVQEVHELLGDHSEREQRKALLTEHNWTNDHLLCPCCVVSEREIMGRRIQSMQMTLDQFEQ